MLSEEGAKCSDSLPGVILQRLFTNTAMLPERLQKITGGTDDAKEMQLFFNRASPTFTAYFACLASSPLS